MCLSLPAVSHTAVFRSPSSLRQSAAHLLPHELLVRRHYLSSPLSPPIPAMELRVGNKYRLGRKIGSGSFGDIYLGTSAHTVGSERPGLWTAGL